MLRNIEDCVRHKVQGCGCNKSGRNYDALALAKGKKADFVEQYIVNGRKKQNNTFKLNVDCSMPLN